MTFVESCDNEEQRTMSADLGLLVYSYYQLDVASYEHKYNSHTFLRTCKYGANHVGYNSLRPERIPIRSGCPPSSVCAANIIAGVATRVDEVNAEGRRAHRVSVPERAVAVVHLNRPHNVRTIRMRCTKGVEYSK